MLQTLRDKAHGWIAWLIIGMIGVTFILFGVGNAFRTNPNEAVVAKVNGKKITAYELDSAYQRYLNQMKEEPLQADPKQIKKELLQSLIQESIIFQAGTDHGMTISPTRINTELYMLPFLSESGKFSPQLYARFLANSQFTDQSFRSLLRDSLMKQQLELGVVQSAFSLRDEVDAAVKLLMQQRDFQYATVAKKDFLNQVSLSNDELESYYKNHLSDYVTPEKVALEYIVISPKNKDAQDEFVQLIDDISAVSYDEPDSLQGVADKYHLEIKKSALFSQAEGPVEALLQHPAIVNAAFSESVKQNGNNSDVMKLAEDHYIVLRVATTVPSQQQTFEQAKESVKNTLQTEKAESMARIFAEKQFENLMNGKNSSLTWIDAKKVNRTSDQYSAEVVENVFSMNRPLGNKQSLKVIRLDNGDYAIIRLTQVTDGEPTKLSSQERESFEQSLKRHNGELEFALYATALMDEAKVEKYLE